GGRHTTFSRDWSSDVCPPALQFQGFAGPLAGIQTGLTHCETEFMVTAPCDSPFLPTDLVQRLGSHLETMQADIAVAVTGEGEQRSEERRVGQERSRHGQLHRG